MANRRVPKPRGSVAVIDAKWLAEAERRIIAQGHVMQSGAVNASSFARSCGLKVRSVNRLLNGETPTSRIAHTVAKALGMEVPSGAAPPPALTPRRRRAKRLASRTALVTRFQAAIEWIDEAKAESIVKGTERLAAIGQAHAELNKALEPSDDEIVASPPPKKKPRRRRK